MIDWLKRLFHKCDHSWKLVHTVEELWYDEDWDKHPTDIYLIKHYECEKCGKTKQVIREL